MRNILSLHQSKEPDMISMFAFAFALFLTAGLPEPCLGQNTTTISDRVGLPTKIAFGSCADQNRDQPVLNTIVSADPDLFIYLGDNIYGDTKDMDVLKAKYDKLGAKPEFQNLVANVPLLSVWDDHDYGWNDAGSEYEFKTESKEIFLDFWQVPDDSPRRSHAGIYGSHTFTDKGRTVQVILLDTRTFRDPLIENEGTIPEGSKLKNQYQPDPTPEKTLLGTEQWTWLESVFRESADLRIVCSSIQFGHEYNGWESWTNLPAERQRMVDLIRNTEANGVLFISGDVHWGEISRRNEPDLYPLYDVTASGLTKDWPNTEPNSFRIGEPFRTNHFGMIEIDWVAETLTMKVIGVEGAAGVEHTISLQEIESHSQTPFPQLIDLDDHFYRQVIVDHEAGQYLGHPTTCLLEDNRTMLCVYPKGHGKGGIVYKQSTDAGLTWSDRLPTPENWITSKEVPTLHRVIGPDGTKRIIMWSGLYPARLAVSEDDGETWSELNPVGDWGGIVVMGFVESLNTGDGHYMAMFHDDGRFFENSGKSTGVFTLYKTLSTDGGLTWSQPESVFASSEVHLCEPGVIRSPDGKRMAVLLRENARRKNSHIIFSDDEGVTWTQPREVPFALTGDRHTGKYGPDGRLFISFRCRSSKQTASDRPFEGDWIGWVGTWDDLVDGTPGQYSVRLKDNKKSYDTTYPGVEILPDGTFVVTTYGHWTAGEQPYIMSVRFRLDELDAIAERKK